MPASSPNVTLSSLYWRLPRLRATDLTTSVVDAVSSSPPSLQLGQDSTSDIVDGTTCQLLSLGKPQQPSLGWLTPISPLAFFGNSINWRMSKRHCYLLAGVFNLAEEVQTHGSLLVIVLGLPSDWAFIVSAKSLLLLKLPKSTYTAPEPGLDGTSELTDLPIVLMLIP